MVLEGGSRRDLGHLGLDRPGGRPAHPGLRVRPGRPRLERARRRPAGRRRHRHRPAHAARPRGVPGPYVLVGHSFGGLYVLSFAARYPQQVAGMVLLDSTAPKPGRLATRHRVHRRRSRRRASASAFARPRRRRLIAQSSYGSLPPRPRTRHAPTRRPPRTSLASSRSSCEANTSMQEASSLTNLGGKPLIVVTADDGHNRRPVAIRNRTTWPHCRPTTPPSSPTPPPTNHCSSDDADSAAASQAIHDVVAAVRSARPLT